MTRSRILLLMMLDLALIGGAGYRAYERYQELKPAAAVAAVAPPAAPAAETPALETSTASVAAPAVETSTTAPDATVPSTTTLVTAPAISTPAVAASTEPVHPTRVAFRYRNSVAKKVFLTGTFNNWTPVAFRKSASGLWTLVVDIAPGDHAYNFLVDGKTVRDPNQRRSDEKGRSLLRVAPASK